MSKLILENGKELPKGWMINKISELTDSYSGGTPSTKIKEYWDIDEIPWIRSGEIKNNILKQPQSFISKKGLEKSSAKLYPPNTVLIAITGATTGKTAFLLTEACGTQNVFGILPCKHVLSKYMWYYMRFYYTRLISKVIGTAQQHVNGTIIKNTPIVYPSLNEQKRIVEKIEELLSKLNFSKQILEKTKILLKQYRQSIMNSAFEGKLIPQDPNDEPIESILKKIQMKNRQLRVHSSEINEMVMKKNNLPMGWEFLTLPDIIQHEKYAIQRGPFGGSLKKEIFKKKGFLVYEQFHAINDDFSMARYFIDEKKYQEMYRFKVNPGDMIVSCSGVTLGRIAQIPENAIPGIINQALLKISLNQQIVNSVYFKFLFRSNKIQNTIFKISRGTGMPNFPSLKEIKSILFPIPPLNEQKIIVAKIEEIFSLIEKFEDLVNLLLLQNSFMKNSILKQAFEGKLVSHDPSDESAEFLLEKIKQEKEQLKQKEKSKKRKTNGR